MLAIPAFRAQYTADLSELLQGDGLVAGLTTRIADRRALIMHAALADPRKPSEITGGLQHVLAEAH